MKILYLTRKYPPIKGGMEKVNFYLSLNLKKFADIELIFWDKSQKWLPFFLFYFLVKSSYVLLTKKIDIIHLGDSLLSPLGLILKKAFSVPITVTVHGLDITWGFWFYQVLIPRCLAGLDRIICVSAHTRKECLQRRIPEEKIVVIPNGIDASEFYLDRDKEELRRILSEELNIDFQDKKILLSVGRLVERKGFHWFVGKVFPEILKKRKDILYLIVGEGQLRDKLQKDIEKNGLVEKVFLLGEVSPRILKLLYNTSDLFVMPNIPVEKDMEGFGLVALEASSATLPVIASKLEGIKDALEDGKNGFLIKPYDIQGFINVIITLLENDRRREKIGRGARRYTLENYSCEKIAGKYHQEFKKVIKEKSNYNEDMSGK